MILANSLLSIEMKREFSTVGEVRARPVAVSDSLSTLDFDCGGCSVFFRATSGGWSIRGRENPIICGVRTSLFRFTRIRVRINVYKCCVSSLT